MLEVNASQDRGTFEASEVVSLLDLDDVVAIG